MEEFVFAVWGTQGGGLAREIAYGIYTFVADVPKGFVIGDRVLEEWGMIPANSLAREQDEDDRLGLDMRF